MKVTLKDIAELAGVSESTASRALNNSPLISEKTRQMVAHASRQLNYQVNRISIIGMIEPNITNPYYSEFISAIESYTYEAGFSMVLGFSGFNLAREKDQIDHLLSQGVQGMILIPTDANADHIQALLKENIPCVILGTGHIVGTDHVSVDTSMGATIATRHLLELGHRRIGLVNGSQRVAACRARLTGYRRALEEYNVAFDPRLHAETEVDENGGVQAMTQLLPQIKNGMSAVYTVSDVMALGAIRKLSEAGLRVPQDISLASCDDIPVAEQLNPPLTTVWHPKRELGTLAAKFLIKQIETRKERGEGWKEKYPFQSATFLPYLIVRQSTRSYDSAAEKQRGAEKPRENTQSTANP